MGNLERDGLVLAAGRQYRTLLAISAAIAIHGRQADHFADTPSPADFDRWSPRRNQGA
jgi:hypothetical protein